jgi:PilZ domain
MTIELQCLLLTADNSLLEVVHAEMQPLNVGLEIRTDSASAREFAERRHLDGFVLDCDDVAGARDLVAEIRQSKCNRTATVLAVCNGVESASLLEMGANFVLGKPVTRARLRSHLSAALPLMSREHRRYFRFRCALAAVIQGSAKAQPARLVNISEGGLALRATGKLQGNLRIAFELPSMSPRQVEVTGEVVWSDSAGLAGVRFLRMSEVDRKYLSQWLESLEYQAMLRKPDPGD